MHPFNGFRFFLGSLALAGGLLLLPQSSHAASLRDDALADLVSEAVTNVKQGQVPQAVKALNRCVRTDKNYAPCHRILGLIYGKTGDDKRAVIEMREYLKLNPKAPDAAALRDLIREYASRS